MSEQTANEAACVPNGYGLCSTHPVCDYMRATVQEYQNDLAAANRRAGKLENELQRCRDLLRRLVTIHDAPRFGSGALEHAVGKLVEEVRAALNATDR